MARYIASSSRSNALFLACAGSSFWEEKATSVYSSSRNCSSATPTAVLDASTVMLVKAVWLGCTRRTTVASPFLVASKALCNSINYVKGLDGTSRKGFISAAA